MAADQFLGMIRANVESFSGTQHLVSGHHVELGGEAVARCLASYQNHHAWASGRWVIAGQEDVRLHHLEGVWRITAFTLSQAWEEGHRPPFDS